MAAVRRSARFSDHEMDILFHIIKKHIRTIESKKIDVTSNQKKSDIWKQVAHEFNSNRMVTKRSVAQIKKRWENLKAKIKRGKSFEIRNRTIDSNGTPDENANLLPKLETHDSMVLAEVKKENEPDLEDMPLDNNLESGVLNTPSNETSPEVLDTPSNETSPEVLDTPSNETSPETSNELSSEGQDPHNSSDANNFTQGTLAARSEKTSALETEHILRVQKLEKELAMMDELHQLNVQTANSKRRKAEAEAAIAELTLKRLKESD